MTEGKIAYWEALGFKAFRAGDHAEAHRNWQQSEHLKRKDNETDRQGKSPKRNIPRVRRTKDTPRD